MDVLIPLLCAAAILCAVLYAIPRIEVIHPTVRMVIIVVTVLCVVLWLLRSVMPRVV